MIRKVGKYTIKTTDEEVTTDNFFKYSVTILEPDFISINRDDLCLWFAQVFRYSNKEQEITDVLKGHILNLKFRITELEKLINK